jgi:hypothetical protein
MDVGQVFHFVNTMLDIDLKGSLALHYDTEVVDVVSYFLRKKWKERPIKLHGRRGVLAWHYSTPYLVLFST